MTEVSSRTTRTDAVQAVATKATQMFDVRSWQGLTQLLKAGKESGMDADAYAEFRDIVLSYAQSGGTDMQLREKIESMATSFNVVGSSASELKPTAKVLDVKTQTPVKKDTQEDVVHQTVPESMDTQPRHFGVTRPRPQFAPTVSVSVQTSTPKKDESTERIVRQSPEASSVNVVPDNLPVSETQSSKSNVSADEPPAQPAAQEEKKHTDAPSNTLPVQESVPAKKEELAASAPTPAPAEVPQKSVEEYKARIAEIKRIVNAEVGNPVMLVGKGNTIGTTYMAALLTAMKAANQGATGALLTAMKDLEAAFEKVMKLSPEANSIATTPVAHTPSQQPEKQKVPAPTHSGDILRNTYVVPDVPQVKSWESAEESTPNSNIEKDITPQIQKEDKPSFPTTPEKHPPSRGEHTIPSLADAGTSSIAATPVPAPQTPQPEKSPQPEGKVPQVVPSNAVSEMPAKIAVSELAVSGAADHVLPDELKASAVTQGLEQLLSEWELFRSSGILGMGTSGSEHPLYKRLAPLSMSIIASGDWEGAKKEEIFSVRDYINGWMQEQSIAYLPEESFDHYLRRVVRKIITRKGG